MSPEKALPTSIFSAKHEEVFGGVAEIY